MMRRRLFIGIFLLAFIAPICFAQEANKEEEALFVAKKAFEDGFYEVSRDLLERFLKNYPASPKRYEANLLIGECYFHQGKFLEALSQFEELLNQPAAKGIRDEALYWVAEVYFKGNNFARAREHYQNVIKDFPQSAYAVFAYYSLGWCLFQERDFPEAIKYFKIVEEKFPKEPQAKEASFKIIECLYNLRDYIAIKEKVKSYLKAYPKDTPAIPYLYFYIAEANYYLNDFNEAIKGYSQVLLNDAGDDKIKELSKLGIGWSYLKLKQYNEAGENFSALKADSLEKINQNSLLLGKAILFFETNKLTEAKNIYNQILAMNPDEPVTLLQAYLGKADLLYNMSEYKEAIGAYKEAQEKVDLNSVPAQLVNKLHYGLAFAFLKEGEFKEAIGEFQKIAQSADDKIVKVSALCQIGDTYQDSGDYKKAQETYDVILKDYPDSLYSDYVQYQLGLTLLKKSNYDGAIMSFLSLKKNFPHSKLLDDASYALGLAYFQRQDYNASREVFSSFKSEFKDSSLRPQAEYLLGTSLYNLGNFASAIEAFKNIIRSYNQDKELAQKAEYEIADCLYRMGNEKEAIARFKALRSKYPDSKLLPEIMWWLGEYYYRRSELDLARRYFSSLIQDFSKSNLITDSYYALGSICIEDGQYQEAIDNFKKVIELDSSDLKVTASIAIADIYVKQEKLDSALAAYNEIVKENVNWANLVYPKIAEVYYKTRDYEKALDFYRRSLDIVPVKETSDIQFRIAEILQAQGRIDDAIEEYLKVTYLYSEDSSLMVKSLLRVAAIYEDREAFKEALNIYKRITAMDVEEAKYAKERIDWINAHNKGGR